MGAEDDHRAWSAYGGRWRMVKVRYPRLSFIWGRKPAIAILVGLAAAGAGYGVLRLMLGLRDWAEGFTEADQAAGWVQTAAAALAAAIPAVVIYNVFARQITGYRGLLGDALCAASVDPEGNYGRVDEFGVRTSAARELPVC